jgi:hypothetical protein
VRPGTATEAEAPSPEMQRLWFATLKKEWNSLVVLPAHPQGVAKTGSISRAPRG